MRGVDRPVAVYSRSQALGAPVVPFHEDLQLIGVEDSAAHPDAHARPQELDPFALARYAVARPALMSGHVLADADAASCLRRALGSRRRRLRLFPRRQPPRLGFEELGNLSADTAQNRRDGEAYQEGERKRGGCSDQDPSPQRHLRPYRHGQPKTEPPVSALVQSLWPVNDSEAVDSRSQAFRAAVIQLQKDQ